MAVDARNVALLELLHPRGTVAAALILGSDCPRGLCPESSVQPGGQADLVVVAPDSTECGRRGWLGWAAQTAARALAPDGFIYVLAPPGCRRKLAELLVGHGLQVEATMLHHPSRTVTQTLVPLRRRAMAYAFTRLIRTRPWRRNLVLQALRLPPALGLLADYYPAAGFVARRPGARPLFDWVFGLYGEMVRPGDVVVSASWRGPEAGVVLHPLLASESQPSAVAKLARGRNGGAGAHREAANLNVVRPAVENAGAAVPRLIGQGQVGGHTVFLQTAVTGRQAATVLATQPNALPRFLARLADWLVRWKRATLEMRTFTEADLEQHVLRPLAALEADLRNPARYTRWLAARARGALDREVPFVATHNDLTMVNVLLADDGAMGVIDWETAQESGLPLVDFLYAAVDAVLATGRYRDRLAAFRACLLPGGDYTALVSGLQAAIVKELRTPPDLALLAAHACWLGHAANERAATLGEGRRPFLDIVLELEAATAETEEADGSG